LNKKLLLLISGLFVVILNFNQASALTLWGLDRIGYRLFTLDTETGTVYDIGILPAFKYGGLDFDNSGNLYALLNNDPTFTNLYLVNKDDGSTTLIGSQNKVFESFEIIGDIAYSADVFEEALYEISLIDGSYILIGSHDEGETDDRITGLASDGVNLYGTRFIREDLVQINKDTGAIDMVIGTHGLRQTTSLAFGDNLYWTAPWDTSELYSLDSLASPTLVFSDLTDIVELMGLTVGPTPNIPDPNDIDDDGDGYTENQGDCDDTDSTIYPNAIEIENDNIDQNCDGYEIIDLGTLGGNSSLANDINNNGQIVGSATTADGFSHAFIWGNGTMTDLGTLGGDYSEANGINDSGHITGYADLSPGGSDPHAFLWDSGTMTDIGTLNGNVSYGRDINSINQIVASSGSNFLWENDTMTNLGTFDPWGINTNSQIAGTYNGHAYLYDNGILTDLGTLGGIASTGYGINDNEQVVGRADVLDGNSHAFLWDNGTMIDLGTLNNTYSSKAYDINSSGQIVGQSTTTMIIPYDSHAFVWDNGVMTDLGTLGGSFSDAWGINDSGQIVGWANTSSEEKHAVLWYPLIPENIDDDGDGYTENEGDCDDTASSCTTDCITDSDDCQELSLVTGAYL
jgi:probable HAF family extracellular repeat protein